MALGYEPKKKSIFDNDNFGIKGLGLNRKKETNNSNLKYMNYGYKKDFGPVVMKEKKNDNYYDFNNKGLFNNINNYNNGNNLYGRKDKFSNYERNNPLFNQFNNDILGGQRRKRNYYSSPNSLGWEL